MGKFERDVAAGKYPGITIDPSSPWIDRESICRCSAGDTITYHGDGGMARDRELADKHRLKVGGKYTIAALDVGEWFTYVTLREVHAVRFNSSLFQSN